MTKKDKRPWHVKRFQSAHRLHEWMQTEVRAGRVDVVVIEGLQDPVMTVRYREVKERKHA